MNMIRPEADVGTMSKDEDVHRWQTHKVFNDKVVPDRGQSKAAQLLTINSMLNKE